MASKVCGVWAKRVWSSSVENLEIRQTRQSRHSNRSLDRRGESRSSSLAPDWKHAGVDRVVWVGRVEALADGDVHRVSRSARAVRLRERGAVAQQQRTHVHTAINPKEPRQGRYAIPLQF